LGDKARLVLNGKLKVLINIHKDEKIFMSKKKDAKSKTSKPKKQSKRSKEDKDPDFVEGPSKKRTKKK
ncbi:hypothetical protein U3516DRAFT_239109, partial [Neocallimastix sp. 'constans']